MSPQSDGTLCSSGTKQTHHPTRSKAVEMGLQWLPLVHTVSIKQRTISQMVQIKAGLCSVCEVYNILLNLQQRALICIPLAKSHLLKTIKEIIVFPCTALKPSVFTTAEMCVI